MKKLYSNGPLAALLLTACLLSAPAFAQNPDAPVEGPPPTVELGEPADSVQTDGDAGEAEAPASEQPATQASEEAEPEFKPLPPPEGLTQLDPKARLWIDKERKLVVVDGQVVLRKGQLEMFACPRQSKEHESVVAVDSKAFLIHTGLLAVGAESGSTVVWQPEYKPATGTEVAVKVLWVDKEGKQHTTDARNWVRNVKTKKPLDTNWVFAGSGFWTDEFDGRQHYLAEAGDLICVSNFPSATLDLPVESSQANAGLLFEAFTENIPPRGTYVRLVLMPKVDADAPQKPGPPAK